MLDKNLCCCRVATCHGLLLAAVSDYRLRKKQRYGRIVKSCGETEFMTYVCGMLVVVEGIVTPLLPDCQHAVIT